MDGKMKALGLALVAACVVSAVMASVASANHLAFQATGEPATWLNGEAEGSTTFTTTAGTIHCKEALYASTLAANSTPTTLVVAAAYSECEMTPIGHAEVHMNECGYLLHAGEKDGSNNTEGTVDIICPTGKEITVTATVAGTVKCTIHIKAQNGLKTVTYTNAGTGSTDEITLHLDLTGIHYTHTKGTGFGACSPGTGNNGTFESTVVVTGESEGISDHVGVKVVHEAHS